MARHQSFRRYVRDESGSYAVEGVLMIPLFAFLIFGILTYVDAFRMQTQNLRATYTVADALSRKWTPVDAAYLNGLGRMHEYQTGATYDTDMRFTVLQYDGDNDTYILKWSHVTDGTAHSALTEGDVQAMSAEFPVLAHAATVLMVESWMDYVPPFAVGLADTEFANRVFMTPRFAPQIKFDG